MHESRRQETLTILSEMETLKAQHTEKTNQWEQDNSSLQKTLQEERNQLPKIQKEHELKLQSKDDEHS